jgi:hypothetical protein
MKFDLLEFYGTLKKKGIIFCFSGPISQDIIEGIGTTLRQKMELEETGLNASQKVFAIFVEQMQNIVNYSAETVLPSDRDSAGMRVGVLIVGQEDGRLYVLTGNRVRKEDTGPLKEQLTHLRQLDKEDLKLLYRDRRKMAAPPESKGAGLGFIEIARKASMPLEFSFVPIDRDHVFFTLEVVV